MATHLADFTTYDQYRAADDPPSEWRSLAGLLADDGRALRGWHAALVGAGTPADVAAISVLGRVASPLAAAVGFAHAYAAAAVVADPAGVRLRFHPRGWNDAVDLGRPAVSVAAGHPWHALPGVIGLPDDRSVADAAVSGLVALVAPVVEICRTMARVGRAGLWNEVGDGATANVLAYEVARPVTEVVVERVRLLGASRHAPWRARAATWVGSAAGQPVYFAHRGGCCLAYREHSMEQGGDDLGDGPWCATCSLRTRADAERLQRAWLDETLAERR